MPKLRDLLTAQSWSQTVISLKGFLTLQLLSFSHENLRKVCLNLWVVAHATQSLRGFSD